MEALASLLEQGAAAAAAPLRERRKRPAEDQPSTHKRMGTAFEPSTSGAEAASAGFAPPAAPTGWAAWAPGQENSGVPFGRAHGAGSIAASGAGTGRGCGAAAAEPHRGRALRGSPRSFSPKLRVRQRGSIVSSAPTSDAAAAAADTPAACHASPASADRALFREGHRGPSLVSATAAAGAEEAATPSVNPFAAFATPGTPAPSSILVGDIGGNDDHDDDDDMDDDDDLGAGAAGARQGAAGAATTSDRELRDVLSNLLGDASQDSPGAASVLGGAGGLDRAFAEAERAATAAAAATDPAATRALSLATDAAAADAAADAAVGVAAAAGGQARGSQRSSRKRAWDDVEEDDANDRQVRPRPAPAVKYLDLPAGTSLPRRLEAEARARTAAQTIARAAVTAHAKEKLRTGRLQQGLVMAARQLAAQREVVQRRDSELRERAREVAQLRAERASLHRVIASLAAQGGDFAGSMSSLSLGPTTRRGDGDEDEDGYGGGGGSSSSGGEAGMGPSAGFVPRFGSAR